MFLKRAMRYYRVWIYSCNLALFFATLVFIILFLWTFSDFRLGLLTSIKYYHPTFIYACIALALQAGILQAIGCIGANRMNEKLLNLYLQILISLLIGDLIVGGIWLVRYNNILKTLKSDLSYQIDNDYGFDPNFQELWDKLQSKHKCCGMTSPYDFNKTQWYLREQSTFEGTSVFVPQSCCAYFSSTKDEITRESSANCVDSYFPQNIYMDGCYEGLLKWLKSTVDTLSVLGFCVITFLKLCFSFILRYEIREMIQKIQIIKTERERSGSTLQNLEVYLPRPSIQNDSSQALLSNQSSQTVKQGHRIGGRMDKDLFFTNPRTSLHHLHSSNPISNTSTTNIPVNLSSELPVKKLGENISHSLDASSAVKSKTALTNPGHLSTSSSLPTSSNNPSTNKSKALPSVNHNDSIQSASPTNKSSKIDKNSQSGEASKLSLV